MLTRRPRPYAFLMIATIALGAFAGTGIAAAGPDHPRLFFDRLPAADDPIRVQGREQVLRAADWALKLEIPTEPVAVETLNRDKSLNPAGLASAKGFLHSGTALESVIAVFGVAARLSNNPAYAARAVQWLNAFSTWRNIDVVKPDIGGAGALVGMVVGYDLFYQHLAPADRTRLLGAIERHGKAYIAKTKHLGTLPLKERRQLIANTHNVSPASAAGLAAVLLKLENRDNGQLLDQVVGVFRNAILPAAFSSEGEYSDGTDQWLVYVMNRMTPFFEALRRTGGPNLWKEGNVPKIPEFLIRHDSLNADDAPAQYRWRFTLLAMAAVYRDAELQGLALKDGLSVGPGAFELAFPQGNAPVDARGARPWYSSAWEYVYYDPTLAPAPLRPRPLAVKFSNLGRAVLRSSWQPSASILHFRAGPRMAKDVGDNNAFQLRAFGADLMPRLEVPFTPLAERGDESYDELNRFQATEGNNTIIVDGEKQFSLFDPRWRGADGAARGYTDWLAGPEGAATAQAYLAGFATTPIVDYVAGEAGNAYRDLKDRRLLERFRRHVFFVKDEYLLVVDEIKTTGGPRDVEWRFHAGRKNIAQAVDQKFVFRPKGKDDVAVALQVLRPRLSATLEKMEARREDYRSSYVSVRGKQDQVVAVFAIDLQRGERGREFKVARDGRMVAIEVGSDIFIWNLQNSPAEHADVRLTGQAVWVRPGAAAVLVDGTQVEHRNVRLIQGARSTTSTWTAR